MKTVICKYTVGCFNNGLSLSGHASAAATVSSYVIFQRTKVNIDAADTNKFKFTISFEPFEKARVVYFNEKETVQDISNYSYVYPGLKKRGDERFICVKYLKRFLGRTPKHKEAIYYRLEPVK